MRKLLLASAVTLGVTPAMTNAALAQTTVSNVLQGVPVTPLPVQAANNANNMAPAAQPNGIANPTPGTIVVHLNGRVAFAAVSEWSSLDQTKGTGPANTGAAKLDPFTTIGFMRLYSGMDGMAANGLRYGASIELRQDFGAVNGNTANSGSSANSFSSTVFVRRAFIYTALDRFGILRMGQGDGVIGLFDNGVTTFQNFDTGGWDGDFSGSIPANANLTFPFAALQGAEYVSSKFVYLSPQLAGFDFGFAYAPNNGDLQDGPTVNSLTSTAGTLTTCSIAASGCQALSASSVALDGSRFRNLTETGVRYQNSIGPVGVYGFGIYVNSGHVNVSPAVTGSQFQGLSYSDMGLALTYGGFTVGGHVTTGAYNGVNGLKPRGGADGNAWLFGAQYSTGPLTLGASYFDYSSQGSPLTVGITQRREQGFAAGSNYTLAPGLVLYLSYLYGTRHQGDFDFATGTTGAANNNIKTQLVALGTVVKW
jgi:Gram-negative porin